MLFISQFLPLQLTAWKLKSTLQMASIARTRFQECIKPSALRSYLAEFISTFFFVFAAVGSTMSARSVTPDVTYSASPLVATALAQGFALFAAIYISADVSGGHINPAVTFAFTVEGYINIPTAIIYCITQMIAATLASLILHVATAGQVVPTTGIMPEMTGFGGAMVESVITFALVYTALVAGDPRNRNGSMAVAGPTAVGMMMTACVLLAGSFTGGSMNPARSFGPAVVSGDFKNQAVYWVGPLVGSSIAALVHQNLMFPPPDCENDAAETSVAV